MKMRKSTIAIVALAVVLAGAITAFGVVMNNNTNQMGQYRNSLESVYKRSFYDLVDDVNNIEMVLGKMSVTTSETLRQNYLTKLCSLADEAQSNLAILPLEHEIVNDTVKFVNGLGGFAFALQQRMVKGGVVSGDELDKIDELYDTSKTVKYELNRLSVILSGGYMIIDNVHNPNAGENGFSSEFSALSGQVVDYPQLIYDGPFSESVLNKEVRGLLGAEVNKEEAKNKVIQWFDDYNIAEGEDESTSTFEVFNFTLTKTSGQNMETIYVQVTKKGGKLLELSRNTPSNTLAKTEEECITIAETYARDTLGIDGMKAVWSTTSNGFLYVNLCYMLDDSIVVYPDMIKVKVSRENGQICGWEARAYYTNHVSRATQTPVFDPATAKSRLDGKLSVLSQRLVIVPGDFVGEVFCYEFKGIYGGSTYYVYVDATTGEEINLLKLIETDDGEMFM